MVTEQCPILLNLEPVVSLSQFQSNIRHISFFQAMEALREIYLNDTKSRLICRHIVFTYISHICSDSLKMRAVDREFEPRLDQTKVYEIGMCSLFAEHAALMQNIMDCWL